MSDELHARLDVLEARIAILEAERANRQPRMTYNWHLTEPAKPDLTPGVPYWPNQPVCYEHYVDPSMKATRNGN